MTQHIFFNIERDDECERAVIFYDLPCFPIAEAHGADSAAAFDKAKCAALEKLEEWRDATRLDYIGGYTRPKLEALMEETRAMRRGGAEQRRPSE